MRSARLFSAFCAISCALASGCGTADDQASATPTADETGGAGATESGGGGDAPNGAGGTPGTFGTGGGVAGASPAYAPSASCGIAKSPLDATCLVADEYSVFVSPGADGTGTRESPLGTIAAGIALARKAGKMVIVCSGDYDEHVVVERGSTGVRAYGGFGCPRTANEWTPTSTRTRIAPATPGTALTIDDVFGDVVFSNIDVTAPDASEPGSSSIAVHVGGSMGVRFEGLTITAGRGADGAAGANGENGADGVDPGDYQKGQDGVCRTSTQPMIPSEQWGGAPPPVSACGSQGGNGGSSTLRIRGDYGDSGVPHMANNAGSAATGVGQAGEDGDDGANGVNGLAGSAAKVAGPFDEHGFSRADGNGGADGTVGQGGGGGGAAFSTDDCLAASGGAGGEGGCAGTGARGGGGGGASVGVLVWDSTTALLGVTIVARDGGRGGDGGKGGPGGLGGRGAIGGSVNSVTGWGGDGGWGGNGGFGGMGSGGTGGPSHALVVHGAEPNQIAISLTTSKGGEGGKGGKFEHRDDLAPAPDGAAGRNDLMLTVQD